jgi:hypothetical protein
MDEVMSKQHISTTSTLNIEAERDTLWQLEIVRDDIRRRGIHWNARLWERTLSRLIACEAARDAKYQQRIDELHDDSQEQRYVEMALEQAITADMLWYEQLATRQHGALEHWLATQQPHRFELAELREQSTRIQARQLALKVWRQQVAIESMERQRRALGRLANGGWARSWAALQAAFRQENLFYQQIIAEKLPGDATGDELSALQRRLAFAQEAFPTITAQRLAWCRQLRAMQRDTEQRSHPTLSATERSALAADAQQLEDAITLLRPGAGSTTLWMVALCVLVLIGLAYFLVQSNHAGGRTRAPGAPALLAAVSTIAELPLKNALSVKDDFRSRLSARWHPIQSGSGQLLISDAGLRLLVPSARRDGYANAQIVDYAGQSRRRFPWRPPLRLTVRARSSGAIAGTAGFGFWNHPLALLGGRSALPAATWFFYASPPSDLPLALGVPGRGWKAASIDATTPGALAWAPLAPPVLLLNNLPWLYRRIWPVVQRSLTISEVLLPPLDSTWHTYTLEWRERSSRFAVDGTSVLETPRSPRGPLGFVAWVDNQWALATPWGRFGWGLLDVAQPQWLDLDLVQIEPLS